MTDKPALSWYPTTIEELQRLLDSGVWPRVRAIADDVGPLQIAQGRLTYIDIEKDGMSGILREGPAPAGAAGMMQAVDFFEAMLAEGVGDVDAYSFHPYDDEQTMAEGMRKLSERMAQLEARSKPEHIAAAVRAELAKTKTATPATVTAPAKRGSSLGLRMFAGGNPAKPAGAAPAIGPQTGSAAKGIIARVDAQLNGRSE